MTLLMTLFALVVVVVVIVKSYAYAFYFLLYKKLYSSMCVIINDIILNKL
jgi:hypothetical protein